MCVNQDLRVEGARWARAAVAGLPLFARRVRQSTLNKRRLQVQFDSIDMIEGAVRRVLDTQKTSPWLDSGAAAEYLSCPAGTMKTWRSRGEGPRYHIIQIGSASCREKVCQKV